MYQIGINLILRGLMLRILQRRFLGFIVVPGFIKKQSTFPRLSLSFQIPPPESHNGPLRGFKIAYRLAGVAGIQFIIRKIENPAATQGNIDGLVQFTTYEVKVLAYNDAGDGVYSQTTPVTTAEGGE